MPILSNVLVGAQDGKLTLTLTDLITRLSSEVLLLESDLRGGDPRENDLHVCVPAKPLAQFINMPDYRINNAPPVFPGIDHITLTPYDTGADTAPNGSVWYDELIVSTRPIAAPGADTSTDTTPPNSPPALTVE